MEIFIGILCWGIVISLGILALMCVAGLVNFIKKCFEESIFWGFFSIALITFFICMVLLYCVEKYLQTK